MDLDVTFITIRSKEVFIEALKDIVKKGLSNPDSIVRERYEWLNFQNGDLKGRS